MLLVLLGYSYTKRFTAFCHFVLGAALGALIFGVVQQGLFFAGVESSLFRVFLGVILLGAVILNTYIRRMITGER